MPLGKQPDRMRELLFSQEIILLNSQDVLLILQLNNMVLADKLESFIALAKKFLINYYCNFVCGYTVMGAFRNCQCALYCSL